ncbi:HTH cro/C1-type domain-containing protein [Paraburkholderia tropica]|uniref:helix-turn-helix domain-containing protein n=1 Tax=Paraburkholderia tropica TaxID=92647 RepID=UPI001CB1CE49|nr:helix-turn-helix transcriptional regulator [Paraburkholderia tropica]CAG9189481.1 HTH cro/C1-type domain-containing protein [Paraburkholderia tropica]
MTEPTKEQRDEQMRPLKRFTRDRNKPEELETLRRNLIASRVLSGMTVAEAAEKFGYANSTELSLIESGKRPIPSDHKFLRQASQVYAVSADFLLGLSPHTDYDGKVSRQHALMRGVEQIMVAVSAQFATAMNEFTRQTQPVPGDFERATEAAREVVQALAVVRKHGLDEVRGSSALIAAVEHLAQAVEPLRQKLAQYHSIASYLDEMRNGRAEAIPYLIDYYAQDARVEDEVFG